MTKALYEWTPWEVSYLRANYKKLTPNQLSEDLEKPISAIRRRVAEFTNQEVLPFRARIEEAFSVARFKKELASEIIAAMKAMKYQEKRKEVILSKLLVAVKEYPDEWFWSKRKMSVLSIMRILEEPE